MSSSNLILRKISGANYTQQLLLKPRKNTTSTDLIILTIYKNLNLSEKNTPNFKLSENKSASGIIFLIIGCLGMSTLLKLRAKNAKI